LDFPSNVANKSSFQTFLFFDEFIKKSQIFVTIFLKENNRTNFSFFLLEAWSERNNKCYFESSCSAISAIAKNTGLTAFVFRKASSRLSLQNADWLISKPVLKQNY
jgi:hypothetical protein